MSFVEGSRDDPKWAWYWAESDADEMHGRDLCDPLGARVLTATEAPEPMMIVDEAPKVKVLHDTVMSWVPVIFHEEILLWKSGVRVCEIDYDIPQRTRYTAREKAVKRYEDTARILAREGVVHLEEIWTAFDSKETVCMARHRIREGSKTRAALAASMEMDTRVTRAQVGQACDLIAARDPVFAAILRLSYLVY